MSAYWKVNIDNFDSFIKYILKKYKNFRTTDLSKFKHYYKGEINLYLSVEKSIENVDQYCLTYEDYSEGNKEWFDDNCYVYMGEYHGRRDKLIMLDKISKL